MSVFLFACLRFEDFFDMAATDHKHAQTRSQFNVAGHCEMHQKHEKTLKNSRFALFLHHQITNIISGQGFRACKFFNIWA